MQALHGVGRRGRTHAGHEGYEGQGEGIGLDGDKKRHADALPAHGQADEMPYGVARHGKRQGHGQKEHEGVDGPEPFPDLAHVRPRQGKKQRREKKSQRAGVQAVQGRETQGNRDGAQDTHAGIGAGNNGWSGNGIVEHGAFLKNLPDW